MKRKTNDLGYMPTLDGLRGIACLLVVYSHFEEFRIFKGTTGLSGSVGVTLFFSLSGFLMSALYLQKPFGLDSSYAYIASRFSRITPGYYIAILLSLILYHMLPNFNYTMSWVNVIRSLLFSGSQGVFWSIPPEVQFYGFFLLLWWSFSRFKKSSYLPLCALGILTAALIGTRIFWPGISLPSKLHIFICGVLGAFLMEHQAARRVVASRPAQIAAIILAAGYVFYVLSPPKIYSDLLFPVLLSFAIASLSVLSPVSRFLAVRPMRFLGNASFSIYLFHEPVLRLAQLALGSVADGEMKAVILLAAAIGFPSLFYVLAERKLNLESKVLLMRFYRYVCARRASQRAENLPLAEPALNPLHR
jgi:peptidoglycan/LPS O-acetylase OafA/YrhL